MESIPKASDLEFLDIKEGQEYQIIKKITLEDGLAFAKLSGDFNPLHVEKEYGASSQFKKNVAHGMFLASLFSALVGMYCPGKKSLYLSQTLNFESPVFYDDIVVARATVLSKHEVSQIIVLKTEIAKESKVCVRGEAKVKLL